MFGFFFGGAPGFLTCVAFGGEEVLMFSLFLVFSLFGGGTRMMDTWHLFCNSLLLGYWVCKVGGYKLDSKCPGHRRDGSALGAIVLWGTPNMHFLFLCLLHIQTIFELGGEGFPFLCT